MVYGDFKDFARRTASDEVLRDKAFNIAKNAKYDEYQRGFASMVYHLFDKKSTGSGLKNNEINACKQWNQTKSSISRGTTSTNYWNFFKKNRLFKIQRQFSGADLADIQLISKFNKVFRYALLIFSVNMLGLFFKR